MLALLQVASQPMMKQKEAAPARTRVTLQGKRNNERVYEVPMKYRVGLWLEVAVGWLSTGMSQECSGTGSCLIAVPEWYAALRPQLAIVMNRAFFCIM
jgi:hypothetical protein